MMSIQRHPWRFAVAAVLATGLGYLLSTDLGTIGILVLVAPVPILLFALRCERTLVVTLAAFVSRLIGSLGLVVAYGTVLPPLALAAQLALVAGRFTLAVLVTRWVSRHLPAWAAALTFAAVSITCEFLMALNAPHGSFGALGYSLIDTLPLLQLASIGGLAAVGFIAALVPASIAFVLHRPGEWRSTVAIAAIPLIASLIFGVWRLAQPYESHTRVGLAAIDSLTAQSLQGAEPAHAVTQQYARLLERFDNEHLEAIVLPERVFLANPSDTAAATTLQAAADRLGVRIVAGFDDTDEAGVHRNTARVFTPSAPPYLYAKRRLVPGLELLTPGNAPLVLNDRGVAICKDMDFPSMFREYGERGARMLFVPAWDFVVDGRLHSRMAVMRGVEDGFAIARAAATGRLTVSDAYGRVVAEAVTSKTEPVTLTAEVGLTSMTTLYSRIGDVFAWALLCLTLVLLIWCALAASRLRARGDTSP
jgi:apolipoprotein N-acyltransferase